MNDATNKGLIPKYTNSSYNSTTKIQPNWKIIRKPKKTSLQRHTDISPTGTQKDVQYH